MSQWAEFRTSVAWSLRACCMIIGGAKEVIIQKVYLHLLDHNFWANCICDEYVEKGIVEDNYDQ